MRTTATILVPELSPTALVGLPVRDAAGDDVGVITAAERDDGERLRVTVSLREGVLALGYGLSVETFTAR